MSERSTRNFCTLVIAVAALQIAGCPLHGPVDNSSVTAHAKEIGVNPAELARFEVIDDKILKEHIVDDQDWVTYKAYATGPNVAFRRIAARHICGTMGGRFDKEARSIAETLSTDPDVETRANSIISLRKFGIPNWRDVAKAIIASTSDPEIINRLNTMLAQH